MINSIGEERTLQFGAGVGRIGRWLFHYQLPRQTREPLLISWPLSPNYSLLQALLMLPLAPLLIPLALVNKPFHSVISLAACALALRTYTTDQTDDAYSPATTRDSEDPQSRAW
jgi:hypothetical protein